MGQVIAAIHFFNPHGPRSGRPFLYRSSFKALFYITLHSKNNTDVHTKVRYTSTDFDSFGQKIWRAIEWIFIFPT